MITKYYDEVLISTYGDDYMTPKKFGDNQDRVHDITKKAMAKINLSSGLL